MKSLQTDRMTEDHQKSEIQIAIGHRSDSSDL